MPNLVDEVNALDEYWHGRGTVTGAVIEAIDRHAREYGEIAHSVETGTGRTTLLFSHHSRHHVVFTLDDHGEGDSLTRVRESPLLDRATTHFVLGPTQKTLLSYDFTDPLDLVFLDGPHAYPFPELEYWAVYPHLKAGGLLIIDDIQIPSIARMYEVLRADRMYDEIEVIDRTAFLRRTGAPGIDPYGDNWWDQAYNAKLLTFHLTPRERAVELARRVTPAPVKEFVKARLLR
jgi:Methyltransferase domain